MTVFTPKRSLLACLLAAALPAAALAQPPEPADLASLPLDALLDLTVSGASKMPSAASTSAAAVTIVTAEEIRAQGMRTLADVLASAKGVMVTTDRSYSYIGVRGFFAPGDYDTRVLLLIDGNRINDNVYDQADIGTEFPLDLGLVERVEFIPGQASAVYGANALFGVINVVTRRPDAGAPAIAEATLGSFGERRLRLADSGRAPDGTVFQWSASQGGTRGEDVPAGGAVTPHGDFEQRTSLWLRAQRGDLSASALHSRRTRGSPALVDAIAGDPATRNRDEETLLDLAWRHATGPHETTTLRGFAGQYRFEGRYALDYPPRTINEDVARGHWWGAEGRVESTRVAGHQFMVGGEWQASPELYQANFDLVDGSTPYLVDSRRSHRGALFAEDQARLADDWTLDASLRWDRTAGYADQTASRVALVWKASETLVVKAIHGTAWRPPNAFEAHYHDDGPGGYILNPALHSESVRGSELNLEWRPAAGDRIDGSVYRNVTRQLIVQMRDDDSDEYLFGNQGRVSAQGIELEWEHAWAGGARLRANVGLQQAADHGTSVPIATYAPRHLANVLATLPVADDWRLGLHWQSVGRRGGAGGYALVDANLSTPLAAHGWSWSIGVHNLFDRPHDDPGTDLSAQPTIAQAGRSVEASATYAF